MFECCKICGHGPHIQTCFEVTFDKKCPCKKFILEKFETFDQVYREYERLLFKYEKDRFNPLLDEPETLQKRIRYGLCDNSKIRILKQWMNNFEKRR